MENRPFVSWKLLEDFMTSAFEKIGVPHDDALICADVLLESDRRGIESHGCNRFKGITGTNARPSIAPTFGVENMLGTNPLTIGLPTDEEFPFVLDCATSITQRGKIEYYARNGMDTPKGMVIGRDGSALTDSKQILIDLINGDAALAPLGGIGKGVQKEFIEVRNILDLTHKFPFEDE